MRLAALVMLAVVAAWPVPARSSGCDRLAEFGSRASAMGGIAASPGGEAAASRGSMAGLARLAGYQAFAGPAFGGDPAASAWSVGGAVPMDGNGLAATVSGITRSGTGETVIGLAAGIPLGDIAGLSAGAGFRARFGNPSGVGARGYGMDFDARYTGETPWRGASFAVSAGIRDALASLNWPDGTERGLPRTGRFGAAAMLDSGLTVLGGLDLEAGRGAEKPAPAAGAEYSLAGPFGFVPLSAVSLRAGWRGGGGSLVTGGLGAKWGSLSLDYALASGADGMLHSVSLAWKGSGTAPAGDKPKPETGGYAAPETPVVTMSNPWRPVTLVLTPPRRVRAGSWSLIISDARGGVVWTAGDDGAPPPRVQWTGAAQDGAPLPDGDYSCRLLCSSGGVVRSLSTPARFRLVRAGDAKLPPPEGPGGF